MSITTALKARREALRDREAGFTLIELLVVVIIIGILAAIAIPIYLGVQNNAKDSGVKADLTNGKTAIASYETDNNGALPSGATAFTTPLSAAWIKYGASQGSNTSTLTYTAGTGANANAFCLLAKSSTGNYFTVTSNTSVQGGTTSWSCTSVTNW